MKWSGRTIWDTRIQGVTGVLCIWFRGWFWLAPAVGQSVFLLGAAYVHLSDIASQGNFSSGNAGPPLFYDIVVPGVVACLFVAHVRLGGMQGERCLICFGRELGSRGGVTCEES